jgi:hypothetical protein
VVEPEAAVLAIATMNLGAPPEVNERLEKSSPNWPVEVMRVIKVPACIGDVEVGEPALPVGGGRLVELG